MSRGARRRPERQAARPMTAREVTGEGESVRSRPEVPVPEELKEGVRPRPLTSAPFRSGRPKRARRMERRKESVVRRTMVYRKVQLVARQRPTAPELLYKTESA